MNERLTDNEFHSKEQKERACYIQEPRLQAIYDKCFEYENIEQELGIDLVTFAKLLECQYAKTTIYVKTSPRAKKVEMKEKLELFADLKTKTMKVKSVARYPTWDTELVYRGCFHSYSFKDYGKTWALTKEELE